jgi:hypothetical protein
MDGRDEIWLPDGRVMPYRRVQDAPVRRRARDAGCARRDRAGERHRRPSAGGERGRHLDIVV